jgi:hypothetical protein
MTLFLWLISGTSAKFYGHFPGERDFLGEGSVAPGAIINTATHCAHAVSVLLYNTIVYYGPRNPVQEVCFARFQKVCLSQSVKNSPTRLIFEASRKGGIHEKLVQLITNNGHLEQSDSFVSYRKFIKRMNVQGLEVDPPVLERVSDRGSC